MKNSAKNKKFIVYIHTTPSNKKYIGITSRTPERRWCNGHGYKTNKHFYNSIVKYGWDNIRREIVAHSLTLEEATSLEKKLILEHLSCNPLYGYNCTKGGEMKVEYSEISRKRMMEASRKRFSKPEERRRMSEIGKLSKPVKKKVWYDNIVFNSISDCASYSGIKRQTLSEYLLGRKSMPKELKDKGLSYHDTNGYYEEVKTSVQKAVICNGVVYRSGRELERQLGLYKDAVREWLLERSVPKKYAHLKIEYVDTRRYYYRVVD